MKNNQDIIDLPHFHAPGRGYMPNRERAAQFMPFKSLKGYDEMIVRHSTKDDSEKPERGQEHDETSYQDSGQDSAHGFFEV